MVRACGKGDPGSAHYSFFVSALLWARQRKGGVVAQIKKVESVAAQPIDLFDSYICVSSIQFTNDDLKRCVV